jgi:uncharacterized spore protein YtfJ
MKLYGIIGYPLAQSASPAFFNKKFEDEKNVPFAGGSGAGYSVNPVGFLVASNDQVKFISVGQPSVTDKLVDYMPELFDKIQEFISKGEDKSKKEKKFEGKNGAVYVSEDIEA